jgi:hypothetical protein
MRPEPKLTITEFKNPAGSVSYRVSGVIDGERIRKNFPTRAEAAAEGQAGPSSKEDSERPLDHRRDDAEHEEL